MFQHHLRRGTFRCSALLVVFVVGGTVTSAMASDALLPKCDPAELDVTFAFQTEPPDQRLIAVFRNISQHSCTMQSNEGLAFGDYRHGHSIWTKECRNCDPAGNPQNLPDAKLAVGGSVRLIATWKTKPVEGGLPCQEAGTVFGPHRWNIWAVSLLGDVCSVVRVDSYLPEAGGATTSRATDNEIKQQPVVLNLSSSGETVYSGDSFWLHIAIEDRDGVLAMNGQSCPSLFLRSRASNGTTSFEEKSGICHVTPVQQGTGRLIRVDMATIGWGLIGVPGENSLLAFALVGDPHAPQVKLVGSNSLSLRVVDPAAIPRKWGPETKGLAISVFLDKDAYPIGEDIPLRMAVENLSADAGIASGELPCSAGFSFEVRDSSGRPIQSGYPMSCVVGGHGWFSRYPRGKVIPVLGMTLRGLGLLPNVPGEYTVSVDWNAQSEDDKEATKQSSNIFFPSKPLVPYATVHSAAVTFRIEGHPPEN